MVTYLIKSTLCLTLFLAFYHLVLEREKMHRFNRYYLLSSVVISFLAPLYTIYIKVIQEPVVEFTQLTDNAVFTEELIPTEEPINYWNYLIYFSAGISLILLIRFFKNLYSIYRKVSISEKFKYKKSTVVLVADNILPHTFWNYIFINKQEYEAQKIEQELFTHELTHVAQKHTFDVLLIELLKVVFWFNPIFYLLKKSVQLNHEFLADTNVVSQHKNVSKYQHLLINTSAWSNEYALASNLHYLVTKKRIVMMTKQTSKAVIRLKKLAVLPLIIGAIFLFAERVEAQEEIIETIIEQPTNIQKGNNDEITEIEEEILTPQGFRVNTGFKDLNGIKHYFVKIDNTIKYYNQKGQLANKNGDVIFNKQVNSNEVIPGSNISKTYFNGKVFCEFKNIDLNKNSKEIEEVVIIEELPLTPPMPIEPLDFIKDKKNATYYYNDKKINYNKAIDLLKKNRPINIKSKKDDGKYIINLSKEPITIIKRKSSKQSISPDPVLKDIKQELKNVNTLKLSINKDTIKKPISVKLGKLSASKNEMKEYKSILAKGKKDRLFTHKGILKMKYLYSTMSKEQRKSVENYASIVPPPPPKMVKKGEKSNIPPPPPSAISVTKKDGFKIPPPPPNPSFTFKKMTLDEANVTYYLDGKKISKNKMGTISPYNIKSVDVKKNKDGSGFIYITSKK